MSNFLRAAYHPKEKVVRRAYWLDDHFGPHEYGVSFPDDPHVYKPEETEIPLDVVFVPDPQERVEMLEKTLGTIIAAYDDDQKVSIDEFAAYAVLKKAIDAARVALSCRPAQMKGRE